MRRYPKIKFSALFLCCICLFPILSAKADMPAAEEWVEIPVLVNIADAADSNNVDAAINKANDILKQAHIRLNPGEPNNVNVGNGDGKFTRAERDKAREDGQKELDKTCGAGKGIKIYVVTSSDAANAGTVGISVHRNPVIIIEPEADVNEMGETIAHELLHSLTVGDHSNDVNDVMYPTTAGNGVISRNDVNEIFPNAKTRGRAYFVVPAVLPNRPIAIPSGINYCIDGHGAILDDFYDASCGVSSYDAHDPRFGYADLREIVVFWDEPGNPNSEIVLTIQLGGYFPSDSPFDWFMCWGINGDPAVGNCPMIHLSAWRYPGDPAISCDAMYENEFGETWPLGIAVYQNDEFDCSEGPVLDNHSLEVRIPAGLVCELPITPDCDMTFDCMSNVYDDRLGGDFPMPISDETGPFTLGLNHPCTGPKVSFIGALGDKEAGGVFGICGSGFPPGSDVDVKLDGELLGTVKADETEGSVMSWWPLEPLEDGVHVSVLTAIAAADSQPISISSTRLNTDVLGYFLFQSADFEQPRP